MKRRAVIVETVWREPRSAQSDNRCAGMTFDVGDGAAGVDPNVPVLARMHQKRLTGYRPMGYTVTGGSG